MTEYFILYYIHFLLQYSYLFSPLSVVSLGQQPKIGLVFIDISISFFLPELAVQL